MGYWGGWDVGQLTSTFLNSCVNNFHICPIRLLVNIFTKRKPKAVNAHLFCRNMFLNSNKILIMQSFV